jgi:hypothetical protein
MSRPSGRIASLVAILAVSAWLPASNDVMNSCDGVLDRVIGGPGAADVAKADAGVDDVRPDVETVNPC